MNKFLGISLAVLGVALAAVPFITDCASQGQFMTNAMGMQMPMRCYGNRVAELSVGVPLFVVGGIMTFAKFKSKAGFLSLSILAVLAGVAGILMPTSIVGTCPNPTEICNTVMKPALVIIGSLTIAGGLVGLVSTSRIKSRVKPIPPHLVGISVEK